jgi:hypothetical protein
MKIYQVTQHFFIEASSKKDALALFYELDKDEMDVKPEVKKINKDSLSKKQKEEIVDSENIVILEREPTGLDRFMPHHRANQRKYE